RFALPLAPHPLLPHLLSRLQPTTASGRGLRGRESWPLSIRRRRRSAERPAARHGPLRESRHASLGSHPEASVRRADLIVQASLEPSLDNSSSQALYGQGFLWPKPAMGKSCQPVVGKRLRPPPALVGAGGARRVPVAAPHARIDGLPAAKTVTGSGTG